ncbi:hypothetical protein LTR28_006366 [Elasticomyces elasticus]|nr:hypothetical protein LTR28_006366 [Elasticomyces elasticus]
MRGWQSFGNEMSLGPVRLGVSHLPGFFSAGGGGGGRRRVEAEGKAEAEAEAEGQQSAMQGWLSAKSLWCDAGAETGRASLGTENRDFHTPARGER